MKNSNIRQSFNPAKFIRRAAHTGFMVLALAGCASQSVTVPEDVVRQRATARWDALISAQFTKAYEFNAPSFRSVVGYEAFRGRMGGAVKWVGAEVAKVDCSAAEKCQLRIRLDYTPLLGGAPGAKFSTHIDETWLFEAGQWWVFQSIKPD